MSAIRWLLLSESWSFSSPGLPPHLQQEEFDPEHLLGFFYMNKQTPSFKPFLRQLNLTPFFKHSSLFPVPPQPGSPLSSPMQGAF